MGSETTRLVLEGISLNQALEVFQPGFHVLENARNNSLAPSSQVTISKPGVEISPLEHQSARLNPSVPSIFKVPGMSSNNPTDTSTLRSGCACCR